MSAHEEYYEKPKRHEATLRYYRSLEPWWRRIALAVRDALNRLMGQGE